MLTPTRLVWAALIIGVASYGVVWAATYKRLTPEGRVLLDAIPSVRLTVQFYASPVWTMPVAGLIAISAVGALFLVLVRR